MNDMVPFPLRVLLAGVALGALVGGYFGGPIDALPCAILGAGIAYGFILISRQVGRSTGREMAAAVEALYQRRVARGAAGQAPCMLCGGDRKSADVQLCVACAELLRTDVKSFIHRCDGCGAGFVTDGIFVYAPEIGGVKRSLCLCCQDYLAKLSRDPDLVLPLPGYDEEGGAINLRFPWHTPSEKLAKRNHQALLQAALIVEARLSGATAVPDAPIFLRVG